MSRNETQLVISINTIARDSYEKWRAQQDRRYSPYNKPWGELTPEQRASVSRQSRNVIDQIRESGVRIMFIDEYAPPGPGDARWHDPEFLSWGIAFCEGDAGVRDTEQRDGPKPERSVGAAVSPRGIPNAR